MALLGAASVLVPALALSEGSSIQAVDSGVYHYWSPMQVSVGAGGAVTFSNPSQTSHGVEWISGPATPVCSAGVPVGATPAAAGPTWSGTCTFAQPGTYTFYCTVHGAAMRGSVSVGSGGETTVTTTTSSPTNPTAPPAPGPGAAGPYGQPPAAQPLTSEVSLASRQRGRLVRGSLALSQAGAGGRLEVDLLARAPALARAGASRQVLVGRLLRFHLSPGRFSFTVSLNSRARRALRRHGRLALTVRIVVTPRGGKALTLTRRVLLQR